ncbi:hypothetical protein [Mucilaginibacter sp. FT3.2]|uniref:hypothetical protein n=1 Tax=Mucilaginibacter sp. FT3.2 TaxID=2723090 RepID=UPI0016205210|nr:hypothetical protein [Mucilaginibacter sp. FT3.2]MBB6232303.1 hypothetical protein [Mucilaginibacter sp. FT3.2]
MATIKKVVDEKNYSSAVINNNMKSHADDPFFLKKVEEAREAVRKITLPGSKKR